MATHFANGNSGFPTTHCSVLWRLRHGSADERSRSLERLAQLYWKPIYKYLRFKWHKSASEAQEITQEFFVHCISKGTLGAYAPERARFRTFLRTCLDRFVLDLGRRERAEKRGGGSFLVSDFAAAEVEAVADPATSDPELIFEAEWTRSVITSAVDSLKTGCISKGKALHFRVFERAHLDTESDTPSYAAIAEELGISAIEVTNRLSYARRELRAIILRTLREVTASDEEFRADARLVLGFEP